ncbi:MAG: hypothetical protein CMJ39_08470 [Phycisphaerae bacterium]|nr:hypothetical protein [Phycisphaerae bacterium]
MSFGDSRPRADLVVANENEVFTLDPQRMAYLVDLRMAYALYEGLLRWNIEDFTLEPAAASSWTAEDGGRVLKFKLRPDARWSNGAPVTAHDFAWSWMRLLLPDTAADYTKLFWKIRGSTDFWTWRTAQLDGFTANPWEDKKNVGKSTANMLERFKVLGSADDLPEAVAWNPAIELQNERLLLLDALKTDDPDHIRKQLLLSPAHEALFLSLQDSASRQAEAEWMWKQAEQVYTRDVGVVVNNDHELTIELETPVPYFPDLLAFGPSSPVYRPVVEGWVVDEETNQAILQSGWHTVEQPPLIDQERIEISPVTGRAIQSHGWARAGKLVGNGPYQLDEWRYKRDLRLSRSPKFHNPDLAGFDSIEIRSIADPNTAVLAFLKGEVDWLPGVSAECRIDLLKQKSDGERADIHAIPGFGTDYFSFNCRPLLSDGRPNPFADARVRRAFALASNKQNIVEGVTRMKEPIASTFVPPNSIPGYVSPVGLGYDPEQARAELASAGWVDRDGDGRLENEAGEPFPDVELLYSTSSPRFGRISVELRDQWERELGIPVILIGQEIKFYKDDLRQGNYMIGGARWYGDYGDPTTFLDLFHSKDGNNVRGFKNQEVDDVLLAATLEADPDKRLRDLAALEARLFQQDLPMLPICQAIDVTMYDPGSLTGVTHHPRLTHYFWNLRDPGAQP